MAKFTYSLTVRLQDTDAAGILYFASQLRFAHEALEQFLADAGCGLAEILQRRDYHLPIVHVDADYRRPVAIGDRLTVELKLERLGHTSFTIAYLITTHDGTEIGRCRTVHVAVGDADHGKLVLPDEIRTVLTRLVAE